MERKIVNRVVKEAAEVEKWSDQRNRETSTVIADVSQLPILDYAPVYDDQQQ